MRDKLTQCGNPKCEEYARMVVDMVARASEKPKCIKRIIKITDKIIVQVFE